MADKEKPKDVFIIEGEDNSDKFWKRCGCAFVCKDGSLNLKLDMFPALRMNIRDKKEN